MVFTLQLHYWTILYGVWVMPVFVIRQEDATSGNFLLEVLLVLN